MIKKQKKSHSLNKVGLFQMLFILAVIFFMVVGIYFINQKNTSFSYKSGAQEVPTPTPDRTPRYNCQALCDQVFKIPENKVMCINPCNKVGDKVVQGMDCTTACNKSIKNGARKQFCYKFCPAIGVGVN
ncbi:MAG: hypothetical protein COZ34_03390 [Candidatus Pacebacteria bacterium CG_4_10_14_3_um_filter_34_15]|nr:MAG: hypothetical protein COZ34_03390 [Candidatus Pacebacteria bacterium CG_4_10_14_3_um_filter_34_15]